MAKLISTKELRAGDVLLCLPAKLGAVGKQIKNVTGSPYTHAAIYLGDNQVGDATATGVGFRPVLNLIRQYQHIAVMRNPDAWSRRNTQILRSFILELHGQGTSYNYGGVVRFRRNKTQQQESQLCLLREYFSNPSDRKKVNLSDAPYFCSELIVACFLKTGFIDEAAAIVLHPSNFAPGDLAIDLAFGALVGYLSEKSNYQVPPTDPSIYWPRFEDIYSA
jgi:uncharacterized protein YycO